MVKRVVTKTVTKTTTRVPKKHKRSKRKTATETITKVQLNGLEKKDILLIENFIGLQKAMTNLSIKFSELSQNLNNLLSIFEIAAKTLASSEKQVDQTLTTKLDALIEQNKTISREINMVDGKLRRTKNSPSTLKSTAPTLYSRQIQAPAQAIIPPRQLPQI